MIRTAFPAIFSLFLATTAAQAAPLPLPVQALLSQFKGEWVLQEKEFMTTKMSLQADGRGQLINRDGISDITWQIEAGTIKVKLLTPTVYRYWEYEDDREYTPAVALQGLTFAFDKFEGLGTILWKMTSDTLTSYPENPEKPSVAGSTVSEGNRLIAGRQFKNFAPAQGQILTLTLPGYNAVDDGLGTVESVTLIGRLDPANVLTVLQGPELDQASFFWTLDKGSLRISDGKGYTTSYRVFSKDTLSSRLLADAQLPQRRLVEEAEAIPVNEAIKAQGFQADSAIFSGCWEAMSATYCFGPDRVFSINYTLPDELPYTAYGLWNLVNGQIQVQRFIDKDGMQLTEVDAMLACEKELAGDATTEKSCEAFQTRSYELLNQNRDGLAVYRKFNMRGASSSYAHVFKRSK